MELDASEKKKKKKKTFQNVNLRKQSLLASPSRKKKKREKKLAGRLLFNLFDEEKREMNLERKMSLKKEKKIR